MKKKIYLRTLIKSGESFVIQKKEAYDFKLTKGLRIHLYLGKVLTSYLSDRVSKAGTDSQNSWITLNI
jgi:hypothetical protein